MKTKLHEKLRKYAEALMFIKDRPSDCPLGKTINDLVRKASNEVTLRLKHGVKYKTTWTKYAPEEILAMSIPKSKKAVDVLAYRIRTGKRDHRKLHLDHVKSVKKLADMVRAASTVDEIEAVILSAEFQFMESKENVGKGA